MAGGGDPDAVARAFVFALAVVRTRDSADEDVVAALDAWLQRRLAEVSTQLASAYGSGRLCRGEGEAEKCRDLEALEEVLRESRDEPTLRQAWEDWRAAMKGIHPLYRELVTLGNEGARSLGFADLGFLWRSGYEMSPAAFAAELDRLWSQVAPLYEALHCHARATLNTHYGDTVVPLDQAIPAHLFGNMWAQDWSGLYPLLTPAPDATPIDVTAALKARSVKPLQMVHLAEDFFTSLGFDPLPQTFWDRSLFAKPSDRQVVCHASAWDVELNNDLRIKQCIKVDHEDLITLHHELGHLFYYQSYYTLPLILQEGANDGFHEGIGDTLALSVTPAYLKRRGLIDASEESTGAELNQLMRLALEKVAFLPFGLLVDQWRGRVFAGEVNSEGDNALWWSLRERYQGIRAPGPRPADAFDPGAKYHIPGNTPYTRYFLAHILQFQFHEALCRVAGHEGPLHRCSIYGSKAAGARLKAMLSLGARRPWPEALAQVTGTREMDARPLLEYFAPLKAYLDTQNQGRQCGWQAPE